MPKPTHADLKQFIREIILKFYDIERDMLVPAKSKGQRRYENDAEHSWSVAVLACSLVEHIDPKLDVGLVSQFATVHDLVEIYAGDISVWAEDDALDNKNKIEKEALEKIQEKFKNYLWLSETLEAYERQDSDEARYVRAIDKYIALAIRITDIGYYKSQKITKEHFDKKLAIHRVKAHSHNGVAEYYEKIREEYDRHPEYFYSE